MMERICQGEKPSEVINRLRQAKGYYITNTARDMSQSDYKNRILPHTDLLAAPSRERAGYFSLEITGGASVHVDVLRKQIDPFLKLQLMRQAMPTTMFQTLCRGVNLFGYRPYPQNVVRLTVREFAPYVEVWRTFDFLNHVPNMEAVFEEVALAGKINEPAICFSTGPEHTDKYYVGKVAEILDVTGPEIILAIKNHGGLGTPRRIGQLVDAIKQRFPDLPVHYHGHNTDGNDIGRILAAVSHGAVIVDASDAAFTGYYGPPPVLTVIQTLKDEGYQAIGIDEAAVIETSDTLTGERRYYEQFESQIRGFQPTVQTHKLPGGAMGSSLEQAAKGGFLDKMPEILNKELPRVQQELGNYWSVTPGSQILWTTAVSNVLSGERYGTPSGDLRNLLLGKYGPFPFYQPEEWIYQKVLGDNWQRVLETEGGLSAIPDVDLAQEKAELHEKMGAEPNNQQLVLYLQYPKDAIDFFKFQEEYGLVHVLPPSIFFKQGGFEIGESLYFTDPQGKEHIIEFGPSPVDDTGVTRVFMNVDHYQRVYNFQPERAASSGDAQAAVKLSKEEILDLASAGDVRAPFSGAIYEVSVKEGQEVAKGDRLVVMEAMKMQTPLLSEVAGIVTGIAVKTGSSVHTGDRILKIDLTN